MASDYPANYDELGLPGPTDKLDDPDVQHDQEHVAVAEAAMATQHVLGLNPQAGYASVRARLDVIEALGGGDLPDPTGQDGAVLGSDGTDWGPVREIVSDNGKARAAVDVATAWVEYVDGDVSTAAGAGENDASIYATDGTSEAAVTVNTDGTVEVTSTGAVTVTAVDGVEVVADDASTKVDPGVVTIAVADDADYVAPRPQETVRSRGAGDSPTAVEDGDVLAYTLDALGYDGAGYVAAAEVKVVVDGTVDTDIVPASIVVSTADETGALTERIRHSADGTTDITGSLTVNGSPVSGGGGGGPGVAAGGTTGQYLRKSSSTDYDTDWDTLTTSDVSGLDSALAGKASTADVAIRLRSLTPAVNQYMTVIGQSVSNGAPVLNTFYAAPIWIPTSMTIDRLGLYCQTGESTSVIRLGMYANGTDDRPSSLVVDAGTVDTSTLGYKEASISPATSLSAGLYWIGYVAQVASSTLRVYTSAYNVVRIPGSLAQQVGSVNLSYTMTGITGTLPGSFTVASMNSHVPLIAYRRAS